MRTFIALELSFEIISELNMVQNSLRDFPAKLSLVKEPHLTLKFLGEISENECNAVKENLSKVKFSPFTLTLYSVWVFPTNGYVRVIWVGIKPQEPVIELQQKIDSLFKEKDARFHPHITLARVNFVEDKKKFTEQLKAIKVNPLKLNVNKFCLFKSTLTSQGPVYEKLGEYFAEN